MSDLKNRHEILKNINLKEEDIYLHPICDTTMATIGWHASVIVNNVTLAGGTHILQDMAVRIAVAEYAERLYFNVIQADLNLSNNFRTIEYPTTSGFAAGFDKNSTKYRSLFEGVERWAWSKWIDDKRPLSNAVNKKLSPLATVLVNDFKDFKFYSKDIKLDFEGQALNLNFLVFLGFCDNGVFPGSRVNCGHLAEVVVVKEGMTSSGHQDNLDKQLPY